MPEEDLNIASIALFLWIYIIKFYNKAPNKAPERWSFPEKIRQIGDELRSGIQAAYYKLVANPNAYNMEEMAFGIEKPVQSVIRDITIARGHF